ncbi:PQQ-binding-like beta-propeller repeat protein, partial [bacterium]|nr:PQQ-binding-like beta-propeller repeat protein [bacterium]
KTLWTRTDLQCRHYRGPGSSPILFGNLLILSMDGVDVQYLVALDKATGRTVWKTPRSTKWTDLDSKGQPIREGDFRKSFGTPLVINAGGRPQMISLGSKATFAYDPRTGKELWKTHHAGHTSVVRPVFGNGIAYTTTGHGRTELWAIRVDGQGDVTDTHVAWKMRKDVPTTPSPLLVDGLLYVVSNQGALTCLDPATGKTVWRERLGGSYIASPICADGRLYFFSTQGKATVLKPGRTYQVLATSRLAGGFMASPATSGRALFLRTKTHLYRIETPAAGK